VSGKRAGCALLAAGAGLLLAALLLSLRNAREDTDAGKAAEEALAGIHDAICGQALERFAPAASSENQTAEETEPAESAPQELTVVTINGFAYIGYLTIPSCDLEVPVMADWSMEKLQTAPCLQYGSPLTDDAVIAGHNYQKHFRALHDIQQGEDVRFTDMTGSVIDYTVANVKILDPRNVYEVINSEYDLVLYTCTTGGRTRVIVGCNRY